MQRLVLFFHSLIVVLLNIISKLPLFFLLLLRLNVRYKNLRVVYSMRCPYLVLPNHTNQWDPFIVSFAVPRPIHWVAGDGAFRDTAFKTLMILGGAIPKIKGQSDMVTIQEIKKAISVGHSAGIFPEGEQNWDGRMLELIPATAKLVRFLKVPVVVPTIRGGYLTKPRWAWGARRSRIEVDFQQVINAEEIKTMKLAEIERRLSESLSHDEFEWQKDAMIPISGEKRAEHLELAHFMCPSCEQTGTLNSSGNEMSCSCGYVIHVNRYGFFEYPEDGPAFDSPGDWTKWQNSTFVDRLKDQIDQAIEDGSDPVLLRDQNVTLMKSERAMPMAPVLTGEARLYMDRIELGDQGSKILSFPFRETTSGNTFKQQKFEFRYEKAQYRFTMPNRSVSGYKWEIAFKGLKQLFVERGAW